MSGCNGASGGPSSELAELIDGLAARLQAGEVVDVEAVAREHPGHAEELRRLLPALGVLDELSRSGEEGASGIAAPHTELISGVLGDFRILREVGRGGMGIVYEAEQISLGRRVALKVLPFAATMDPRQLQRFHNEARAAASLDHPHIVHVHAVGCERAVHFYAMQFIEGQTLAAMIADLRRVSSRPVPPEAQPRAPHAPQVLAETALQAAGSTERRPLDRAYFRRVAELGAQAAEALDHAHALGIVHRDIKPANLLVDGRGGLWVTDFGLAHVQSDARLTMTGDLVGTLRYMAPEQALAKRVVIDHRTDVYSLGATLYELLTLRPVFAGTDRQELLRQIAFEEPVKPRRLERAAPAELETIVLKCLEKGPADRYATAKELADDLRRFLDDKPIQARRPSLRQVTARWARRHRAAVWAAAAVALLALAGAAAGTFWHVRQLEAAAQREQAAAGREREQARRATRQRDAARRAVNDMYTEVAERWLARQPRLQPIQREFLEKALRYFQELTETDDAGPEARLELGRSYLRVGNIQAYFGDNAQAEQAFRRAADVLQALTAERPGEAEAQALLASAWSGLSHVLARVGDNPQAEQAARRAIALFEQLKGEGLASLADQARLASSYLNLGHALERTKGPGAAEEAYRKALRIQEELAAQSPADPDRQMALASNLQDLSAALFASQRFKLAQEALERGVRHAERAVKSDPASADYRARLAVLRQALGVIYCQTNQLPAAEQSLRRAREAQARLAGEYPDIVRHREELALTCNVLGCVYDEGRRPKEAEEAYGESIKIKERLAADSPGVPYYRLDLVQSLNNLTDLLTNAGRAPEATRANDAARRHAERLLKDFPGVADHQKGLARTHQRRAEIELAAGRAGAAAAEWKRALEVSSHPDIRAGAAQFLAQCPDPKHRDLARAVELARENVRVAAENRGYWETLGLAEYRAGHAAEAVRALEQAVRLGSTEPGARLLLAMARRAAGDREGGRREYDAIREKLKKAGGPAASALLAEAAGLFDAEREGAPPPREKR
jgi:serine/threonine protein kinase